MQYPVVQWRIWQIWNEKDGVVCSSAILKKNMENALNLVKIILSVLFKISPQSRLRTIFKAFKDANVRAQKLFKRYWKS